MGHTNPSAWIMIFFFTKVTIFENLMKKLDSSWSSENKYLVLNTSP